MRSFWETAKKGIFLLILLFSILFISSAVFALEVQWPRSPAGTELTEDSNLTILVKYLYEWGIVLGGLVVFFVLIFAGFQYLTSAGDPLKMKEARERIVAAVGGLVLLLGSWLILNTLNPELTRLSVPSFGEEFGKEAKEAWEKLIQKGEEATEKATRPCDFAIFYSAKNYDGASTWEEPRDKIEDIPYKPPFSVRIVREATTTETVVAERGGIKYTDGGSCILTLYVTEKTWFGLFTKKVEIVTLGASTPDLSIAVDIEKLEKVDSFRLTPLKL